MRKLVALLVCCALPSVLGEGMVRKVSAEVRALAAADGTVHYSDRLAPSFGAPVTLASERAEITAGRMGGRWLARAEDGSTTVLELRPGGGFALDRQSRTTPERAYACGGWTLEGGELALRTKTRKTRSASGVIDQSAVESTEKYTVLAARSDTLVLRGDGGTLTFRRRGA
jgi:hypothetical protein